MAYPKKMREKALTALRNGHSRTQINELYGLSNTTLRDWEILEKETGSLNKRKLDRKPTKIADDALRKYCEENPFATHIEAASHFGCSESGIRKAKKRLNISRKKRRFPTQNVMNKNGKNSTKQ